VKRAREINNKIDWKCFHCLTTNFARVICGSCTSSRLTSCSAAQSLSSDRVGVLPQRSRP